MPIYNPKSSQRTAPLLRFHPTPVRPDPEPIWELPVSNKEFDAEIAFTDYDTAVIRSQVYNLICVRLHDGQRLWQVKDPGIENGSGRHRVLGDELILSEVGSDDQIVHDVRTGDLIARRSPPQQIAWEGSEYEGCAARWVCDHTVWSDARTGDPVPLPEPRCPEFLQRLDHYFNRNGPHYFETRPSWNDSKAPIDFDLTCWHLGRAEPVWHRTVYGTLVQLAAVSGAGLVTAERYVPQIDPPPLKKYEVANGQSSLNKDGVRIYEGIELVGRSLEDGTERWRWDYGRIYPPKTHITRAMGGMGLLLVYPPEDPTTLAALSIANGSIVWRLPSTRPWWKPRSESIRVTPVCTVRTGDLLWMLQDECGPDEAPPAPKRPLRSFENPNHPPFKRRLIFAIDRHTGERRSNRGIQLRSNTAWSIATQEGYMLVRQSGKVVCYQ